ncbi:MAG: hypothetical protein LBT40_05240 [Deltaproteobacteria bacterium]|jgi:hypothetical protein|nr:hypothetical protein [Deltaproteobacteria bacterium]
MKARKAEELRKARAARKAEADEQDRAVREAARAEKAEADRKARIARVAAAADKADMAIRELREMEAMEAEEAGKAVPGENAGKAMAARSSAEPGTDALTAGTSACGSADAASPETAGVAWQPDGDEGQEPFRKGIAGIDISAKEHFISAKEHFVVGPKCRRREDVRSFRTETDGLIRMEAFLREQGTRIVAIEATACTRWSCSTSSRTSGASAYSWSRAPSGWSRAGRPTCPTACGSGG